MAGAAISADARPASAEKSTILPHLSRRALFGSALVAGATSLAPAALANVRDARPWDVLRRRFEAERAQVEHYRRTVYEPASAPVDEFHRNWPPSKVDLMATNGVVATYSIYHEVPSFAAFDPVREAKRASDAYAEKFAKWERASGWLEISNHMDAIDSAEWAARSRLMEEPAPDAAALGYKLKLALELDGICDGDRDALAADVERLAAGGGLGG